MTKLKQLRKELGLTQELLANAIGVNRTNIADWESGRSEPSIKHLKNLATYLKVSLDTLLDFH
jgi:transcriptional regulator with XRE-family HTH domain